MFDHLSDPDMLIALLALVSTAVVAAHLALARYRAHKERMIVLGLVEKMTAEAFDAADILVADSATPSTIRKLIAWFNDGLGSRELAVSYFSYEDDRRGGSKLPINIKDAIEKLADRRDLLDQLRIYVTNARLITLLRWKETQQIGLELLKEVIPQSLPERKEIDEIERISEEVLMGAPSRPTPVAMKELAAA